MAKKAGRPKGPKTVRHNIVLPIKTSKLLRKYSGIVNADISETVEMAIILLWQVSLKEADKINAQQTKNRTTQ